MVTGVGITDTIKSLSDLHVRCNLHQVDSDRFFSEWVEDLPNLDERERAGIDRIKQRYDYHRFDGLLLEGTINLVVVSPLLELAGFLDPPFRLRSPYGIALELDDPESCSCSVTLLAKNSSTSASQLLDPKAFIKAATVRCSRFKDMVDFVSVVHVQPRVIDTPVHNKALLELINQMFLMQEGAIACKFLKELS